MNLIEIFWRKLKYGWLPFSAYLSFAALKQAIAEIFDNVGEKYRITFAWILMSIFNTRFKR